MQEKCSKGELTLAPNQASKVFKITNELGLHARAAAKFVKVTTRYSSEILVQKDSREVNGKSIMGILMLAAAKGSHIEVTAIGSDCQEALQELEGLVNSKFGEK